MTVTQSVATKLSVAAVAIAMVVSFAAFTPAKAQTTADLQAQIASLMATINALQAKLGVTTTTTATTAAGVCPYTWTRTLKTGSTGADVMKLQQFLNANAATQVAVAGKVGSAGMESSYYGPATGAAVAKFQQMYRTDILAPLGLVNATTFFGNSTMAKANALCVAAASTTTTTTSTTTTTTTTPVVGLGHNSGQLQTFGQVASDAFQLYEGQTAGLFAFNAKVMGDVSVNRVQVYMQANPATQSTNPLKYFQNAQLMVNGKVVGTVNVADWTKDTYASGVPNMNNANDQYEIQFNNVNAVFANGAQPTFQVALTANNTVDTANQTQNWVIGINGSSIRTIDGQGFTDTVGSNLSNSFTMQPQTVGKLSVSTDVNNPTANTVQVSKSVTTNDIPVLIFDIREQNGVNTTVNKLTATIASSTGNVVKQVSLWNGSTQLSSQVAPLTNTPVTFENLNLQIPANGTVVLTVKVTVAAQGATYSVYGNGATVAASFGAITDAMDVNGNDQSTLSLTGAAAGYNQTLISTGLSGAAATIPTPVVTTATLTGGHDTVMYTIPVTIQAFNQPVYIARNAATSLAYTLTDGSGTSLATTSKTTVDSFTVTGTQNDPNYFVIPEGSTETLTMNVKWAPGAASASRGVQLNSIMYGASGVPPTQTWNALPSNSFRTSAVSTNN